MHKARYKSVCLKFNDNMPFKSYNYTAFIGGAALADKEWDAYPYFLSKHVLLMSNDIFDVTCDDMIMFNDRNIFDHKALSRKLVEKQDIKEELITMLFKGYYVSITIDEYDIPNKEFYKKREFYHDLLIYGYDLDRYIFYTAGYDKTDYFGYMEYDMELICKSASKCLKERKTKPHLHFFRPRPCREDFILDDVKKKYQDYLNSCSASRMIYNAYYGIGAYDSMIRKYRCMHENNSYWRKASFSMLFEHKKFTNERMRYIKENIVDIGEDLMDDFLEIANDARTIELQSLKYEMLRNDKNMEKVCDRIKIIREKEIKAISIFLERV